MSSTARREVEKRVPLALFCLALTVYAFFAQGCIRNTDGATMAEVTGGMVERWDFAVGSHDAGSDGLDGRHYSQYGLGVSLAAVPLYLLGKALYALSGGRVPLDVATDFGLSWLNPLVGSLLIVAVYALSRRVGLSARAAIVAALTCGLATNLAVHIKDLFSEPLACLCLVGAFIFALRTREEGVRAAAVTGLLLGAAFLTRAAAVVALPALLYLVVCDRDWRQRLAPAAALALGVLPGFVVFAVYNVTRFGAWSETGYWSKPFLTPLLRGLDVWLLSPERGLLWYSPALVLLPFGVAVLWQRARPFVIAAALFFAAHLALHATFGDVYAGQSWGSRFMVPALPLLCVFVGGAWETAGPRRRPWLVGIILVSVLAQFPGLYVNPGRYFTDMRRAEAWPGQGSLASRIAWSPLVRGWVYVPEVTASLVHPAELRALSARPGKLEDAELEARSLYLHIPYIWWVMAIFNGVPAALGIAVGLGLVTACGVAALWLRRLWRETDGFPETDRIEVTVSQ